MAKVKSVRESIEVYSIWGRVNGLRLYLCRGKREGVSEMLSFFSDLEFSHSFVFLLLLLLLLLFLLLKFFLCSSSSFFVLFLFFFRVLLVPVLILGVDLGAGPVGRQGGFLMSPPCLESLGCQLDPTFLYLLSCSSA